MKAVVTKKIVPCVVCGSASQEPIYEDELGDEMPSVDYAFSEHTRKTFRIVRCKYCGHIFTNPMPQLSGCYEDTVDKVYIESSRQRYATARRAVSRILKFCRSGRLLDVGCSTGIFLDEAKKYFDVQGVEISSWAAKIASQRHQVYQKPLSELGLNATFDVITLWGVIEHFKDPFLELSFIHNALVADGLCVIYTGDVSAWLPRLLKKRWWWYQGMHLHYFSKNTLSILAKRCGFEVVGAKTYCSYFQLFSLARSISRYRIGRLLAPILQLPKIKKMLVPLSISGEMAIYLRRVKTS